MRQAIRQHFIVTYAISLGLMTALLSLFQPIPSASAQQLIGPAQPGNQRNGHSRAAHREHCPHPSHTQRNPWRRRTRKPRPSSRIDSFENRRVLSLQRFSQFRLTHPDQPLQQPFPHQLLMIRLLNPKTPRSRARLAVWLPPPQHRWGLMSTAAVTTQYPR